MAQSETWSNRLIDVPTKKASEFKANPKNFRTHPRSQQRAVKGSLDQSGWVQPVVVNRTTGHLLDGHERVERALKNGDQPVPYVEVEISEAEEGIVLSSLDPIAALATIDQDILAGVLGEITTESEDLTNFFAGLAEENDIDLGVDLDSFLLAKYSHKIEAPIYKITGAKPDLVDLVDTTKRDELVAEIDRSRIPEEVKIFLRMAAERHLVFNYRLVAEYYAHATKKQKELIENSGLVIIDFGRAIELGYVRLAKAIADQYLKEYGSDEE
jgi:hypothetical protein